jgi:UDP-glucose 4-epimerase
MQNDIKAVVTGGAGFIGSHITEELIQRGYHVIVIDDLSTGKMENIQHLLDEGNLNFVRGSITDLALLQKFFSDADYIFHQAAIPSVPRSIKNPLASNEVNVTGTLNVLSAARDQGIKKVIFASSSSVYGDTPNLPKREDMTPNPQSPYAVTKLAAEYYCRVFTDVYGISTICLRYFNVFGARQNPDSQYAAVIPKFIKAIKEGKPPVIFGDGEQTRDFTFIKDVVHANILAAESKAFGIFNIGKGDRISINQLAQIILKLNGKENIKPLYEKGRLGDIKHSLADISKAQSFGYKPEYDVEKGIVETIRSFKYVT